MLKSLLTAFLLTLVICGIAFANDLRLGMAQVGTNVAGIISSDTTWTKAKSPFNLTGPVVVNSGVTLTVEAGATVNLGQYYIQVNGSLVARGIGENKIQFNEGPLSLPFESALSARSITLTASSSNWNEQTGTGCIIENAVFNLTRGLSVGCSAKIEHNVNVNVDLSPYSPLWVEEASPIISGNTLGEISINGGSPVIINNTSYGGIVIDSGSAIISNNTIYANILFISILPIFREYGIKIAGNNNVYLSDNVISVDTTEAAIVITGGTPTIQRNLITNSYRSPGREPSEY